MLFKTFFTQLVKLYSIASNQLIPYEHRDKQGNVESLTLFIPWQLVTDNKLTVADISPLLPEGWYATESKKLEHQQAAMDSGKQYTYSIAISEQTDSADVMAKYLSAK